MASVLRMPGVSADATEAALLEWSVEPGATVRRGDVLANIETEKAVVELEAEEDAILFKTLAVAGEMVPIGGPIAVFTQPGESQDEETVLRSVGLGGAASAGSGDADGGGGDGEGAAAAPKGPQADGPLAPEDEERSQDQLVAAEDPSIGHTVDAVVGADPPPSDGASAAGPHRIFASPLARRLASEAGLALHDIDGTGPGGRIRRRDIEAALSRPAPVAAPAPAAPPSTAPSGTAAVPAAPAPAAVSAPVAGAGYTDLPHTRFRTAVAKGLTASKQNVPHFYLKASCRVDALLALRQQVNAAADVKITINDFVVKAAARAMVEVPDMNVIWTAEAVRRFDSVDIAVAVASERGLLTPVLRGVQSRSLSDLSAGVKDLAARGGAGTLKQHELEGGTLTISNLGMFGVEEFSAIINPPQVGILAVGAVVSRPVEAPDGSVAFGKSMTVVLSADHRPIDGALAARWLAAFRELLENPFRLLV